MPTANTSYEIIKSKIESLKTAYPSLRDKRDEYVFSALCVKSNLYKNPAFNLTEADLSEMIVDGQYDGGVDILLTDPSSDDCDLVIAQSKFYTTITTDDAMNALNKMAQFYKDMQLGHYEGVNATVQRRFLSLQAEMGEDAKVVFILYASAPKSRIQTARLVDRVKRQFTDPDKIDIKIYFGKDIEDEIKEAESRRHSVEYGKVKIDEPNNYLLYGEEAAIINVSAFSIKKLYAMHLNTLLAKNLRYHIKNKDIDNGIKNTIKDSPNLFWMMNNGITIICDDFVIDGKEVKLTNFSIINGGQTTFLLHKSQFINEEQDLFLPCKIIRVIGETEAEKDEFSLSIAKATNSQKAIKPSDLKANAPEQLRFSSVMREVGVYYQTKRGEEVPSQFKPAFLNSDLLDTGKLCLAAVFQLPGTCRNKPKTMYDLKYYEKIFGGDRLNQLQIARLCRELLYVDFYFRTKFIKKYDKDVANEPDANERIAFAHNARTVCIAFVAFAGRYCQDNFSVDDLRMIHNAAKTENVADSGIYPVCANLKDIQYLLPPALFANKDHYESILEQLFLTIINAGIISFNFASEADSSITATNYLKKDKSYFSILKVHWNVISSSIKNIWNSIE